MALYNDRQLPNIISNVSSNYKTAGEIEAFFDESTQSESQGRK